MEAIRRRDFLAGLNLALGGLSLGLWPRFGLAAGSGPKMESGPGFTPNVFVHVAPSGLVTLVCARSEMGQGIRSSLPVLLADELGADMAQVKVVQADGDPAYGDQNTDGSHSIRGNFEALRRVAAAARMLLVQAAALRWQVEPSTCTAHRNRVVHTPTGRTVGFGDIASAAAQLPIPKAEAIHLRPDSELTHVGTDLPLYDGPSFVTGAAQYGADVRLPGMLVAVVARPPVAGGTFAHYDAAAALAVSGVKAVLELPQAKRPYAFQVWGGLAVLAEHTWAALRGRAALRVEWVGGENAAYDSDAFRAELSATVHRPGEPQRNVGDVEAALAKAAHVVEAEYHVPHLCHIPMEPPAALAHVHNDTCEIWTSTQNPQAARAEAAKVLGLPEDQVTVHVTFLGGGFGRKSKADFVAEAALLSKLAGAPVRVQWTREDDLRHDYYNAVSTQLLTAGLDAAQKVTAWRHRTAFTPIGSTFGPVTQASAADLQQGVLDLALAVPHVRAETGPAAAHIRVGWLRSVYNIFHAFAEGCFFDELAAARGLDPRENLLELLGPPRQASLAELGIAKLQNYGAPVEQHPVDVARLRGVIERVTAAAHWGTRKAENRHLGLAAHRSFLSYTAAVVSVVKRSDGKVAVDEAWVACDAGRLVNTDRVRSQMEGAVIFGLSHAFYGGATMKGGATVQSNFHDYRLLRIGQAPRAIHVELVKSDLRPGGVGEPGVPPVAPALANAIFALTGTRLREMPFHPRVELG